MKTLLQNQLFIAYSQIFIGALFNLITVYMAKKADGFTNFWPSFWTIVTISITQWMISKAMASGIDVGIAIVMVVVTVMVGSFIMGLVLFNETASLMKIAGISIAVLGVLITSLAK